MTQIKLFFAIAIMINVFLFLGQVSVCKINPSGCTEYFIYEGSFLQELDAGNFTLDSNVTARLPSGQVNPTPGILNNLLFNPLSVIKKFVEDFIGLFTGLIFAVPNAINGIGLPQEVSFAIGTIWYLVMTIMTMLLIVGRN